MTIADVPEESRFLYQEDETQAELDYHRNSKGLILIHTEVPEQLGGRGIGGRLVRAALERARA